MFEVRIGRFNWFPENKTFTVESSMLNLEPEYWNSTRTIPVETEIKISNPKTGKSQVFYFTDCDKDPENEVAGWNYKSKEGNYLLIIND